MAGDQDAHSVFDIGQDNEKMILAEGFSREYAQVGSEEFQYALQFSYDVQYKDVQQVRSHTADRGFYRELARWPAIIEGP